MEIDKIFIGEIYKIDQIISDENFISHRTYTTILYKEENSYLDMKSGQSVSDISNISCPNIGDLYIDSTFLIPYQCFYFSNSYEDTKTMEELQSILKQLNGSQKQYK